MKACKSFFRISFNILVFYITSLEVHAFKQFFNFVFNKRKISNMEDYTLAKQSSLIRSKA